MNRTLPARLALPVIFGVALATGFSGAVVPGSLLAVVVKESVRVGWAAGPLMMVGHGALELVAVMLLATGLIRCARSGRVRGSIGLVGGGVLICLGYVTFGVSGEAGANALGGPGAHPPSAAGMPALQLTRLGGLGALMSITNPYWWLWWATIGVAHVGWAMQRGRVGGGTYLVGHVLSDVLWYCAVAAALSAGRALFSAGVLRGIYVGCGVFLVALGVVFAGAAGKALLAGKAVARAGG